MNFFRTSPRSLRPHILIAMSFVFFTSSLSLGQGAGSAKTPDISPPANRATCETKTGSAGAGQVIDPCERKACAQVTTGRASCETYCTGASTSTVSADSRTTIPAAYPNYKDCLNKVYYTIQGAQDTCLANESTVLDKAKCSDEESDVAKCAAAKKDLKAAKFCDTKCQQQAIACKDLSEYEDNVDTAGDVDAKPGEKTKAKAAAAAAHKDAEARIKEATTKKCDAVSNKNVKTLKDLTTKMNTQHEADKDDLAKAQAEQIKNDAARASAAAELTKQIQQLQAAKSKLQSDLAALPQQANAEANQIKLKGRSEIEKITKQLDDIQTAQSAVVVNDAATEAQAALDLCWAESTKDAQDYLRRLKGANNVSSQVASAPDVSSLLTMSTYGSIRNQDARVRQYFYNLCISQPPTQGKLATAARKQITALTNLNSKSTQLTVDLKTLQVSLAEGLRNAQMNNDMKAQQAYQAGIQLDQQMQAANAQVQQASALAVKQAQADKDNVDRKSALEAQDAAALKEYRSLSALAAKYPGNADAAKNSDEDMKTAREYNEAKATVTRECCKDGTGVYGMSPQDEKLYCRDSAATSGGTNDATK